MKIIRIILSILLVNFFYFSTAFTFSGNINTKMILALWGVIVLVYNAIKGREGRVPRYLFVLTLLASIISLCSYGTMTLNSTSDSTYLDYVVSMGVWFAAAYGTCTGVSLLNNGISIPLLSNYVIAVSLIQSVLAFVGSISPVIHDILGMYIPGTGWLDSVNRLYGFGMTACLDTGGIRFAFALVLTAYMIKQVNRNNESNKFLPLLYIISFLVLSIFGNMVARTTSIGMLIGALYLLYNRPSSGSRIRKKRINLVLTISAVLTLLIPIGVRLYKNNMTIQKNTRFAFEGVFNLVEKGRWEVASNNKLKTMYVFPDNLKTWVIGDGYFNNPKGDQTYVGDITEGYYKNTDVGYLRFIFYFGLVGLAFFCIFMFFSAYYCSLALSEHSILAWLTLILHFVIWLKVATDCFFILALLMNCRGRNDNQNIIIQTD